MWTWRYTLVGLIALTMVVQSCGLFNSGNVSERFGPVVLEDVRRIGIPDREHGYGMLENTVIKSHHELDQFITLASSQAHWNNRDTVIAALRDDDTDFSTHNIVIYPHTEPSGSITLTPHAPIWEDREVVVVLDRYAPDIQTGDMAYHAYAYRVSKNIGAVVFEVGNERTTIVNASD